MECQELTLEGLLKRVELVGVLRSVFTLERFVRFRRRFSDLKVQTENSERPNLSWHAFCGPGPAPKEYVENCYLITQQ